MVKSHTNVFLTLVSLLFYAKSEVGFSWKCEVSRDKKTPLIASDCIEESDGEHVLLQTCQGSLCRVVKKDVRVSQKECPGDEPASPKAMLAALVNGDSDAIKLVGDISLKNSPFSFKIEGKKIIFLENQKKIEQSKFIASTIPICQ